MKRVDSMSGEKKRPLSPKELERERDRKLEAELEKYAKAMKAAMVVNPEPKALFEEVGKREKEANCVELREMLEKTRLLRFNVKWEDQPESDLVNHIFSYLIVQLKRRCPKMWIEYADEWAPKWLRRMEEALQWDKVKPRKSKT